MLFYSKTIEEGHAYKETRWMVDAVISLELKDRTRGIPVKNKIK